MFVAFRYTGSELRGTEIRNRTFGCGFTLHNTNNLVTSAVKEEVNISTLNWRATDSYTESSRVYTPENTNNFSITISRGSVSLHRLEKSKALQFKAKGSTYFTQNNDP